MIFDAYIMEHGTSEGCIFVIDMENTTLGHIARLEILTLKRFMYYLQDAMPTRIKGIHVINIKPFVDKIVFLMRPFMKKELWNVFHLHTSMDSMHKFVEHEVFPANYPGGKGPLFEEMHGKVL